MLLPLLMLLLLSAKLDESPHPSGQIHGVVVNGTNANEPLRNVPVVLRAGPGGVLDVIAKATTDHYGKFTFENLPVDLSIIYLPGADRDGVHYPGQRSTLDGKNPFAYQKITVFDAIDAPSPLIARRHEIDINVEQDYVSVNETLVIENPSLRTYVGKRAADESTVTLGLSVPTTFDRVTFTREFFGRRFRVVEHQPVTDIPWPPGNRELKFAYRIPGDKAGAILRRTLDVPCRAVTLRVRGKDTSEIFCNLKTTTQRDDEMVFACDEDLPAGRVIELQLGAPPTPWLLYARSGSLVTLIGLLLGTVVVLRRRDSLNSLAVRTG